MSWPLWNQNQYVAQIQSTPMSGAYTPEQWAAMQQQNWQQWSQWQQQYSQWQDQYGAKYNEQIAAMGLQATQPPLPPPQANKAPPPPPPAVPPPPPHENNLPLFGNKIIQPLVKPPEKQPLLKAPLAQQTIVPNQLPPYQQSTQPSPGNKRNMNESFNQFGYHSSGVHRENQKQNVHREFQDAPRNSVHNFQKAPNNQGPNMQYQQNQKHDNKDTKLNSINQSRRYERGNENYGFENRGHNKSYNARNDNQDFGGEENDQKYSNDDYGDQDNEYQEYEEKESQEQYDDDEDDGERRVTNQNEDYESENKNDSGYNIADRFGAGGNDSYQRGNDHRWQGGNRNRNNDQNIQMNLKDDSRSPGGDNFKPNTDMTDEERQFEIQFKKWEDDFQKWKEQNVNHPDKHAYREYENKFESCRVQLLERRKQMLLKRTQKISVEKPVSSVQVVPKQQFIQSQNNVPLQNESEKRSNFGNTSNYNEKTYNSNEMQGVEEDYPLEDDYDDSMGTLFPSADKSKGIPGLDLVEGEPRGTQSKNEVDVILINDEDNLNINKNFKSREHNANERKNGSNKVNVPILPQNLNSIVVDKNVLNVLSMVNQGVISKQNVNNLPPLMGVTLSSNNEIKSAIPSLMGKVIPSPFESPAVVPVGQTMVPPVQPRLTNAVTIIQPGLPLRTAMPHQQGLPNQGHLHGLLTHGHQQSLLNQGHQQSLLNQGHQQGLLNQGNQQGLQNQGQQQGLLNQGRPNSQHPAFNQMNQANRQLPLNSMPNRMPRPPINQPLQPPILSQSHQAPHAPTQVGLTAQQIEPAILNQQLQGVLGDLTGLSALISGLSQQVPSQNKSQQNLTDPLKRLYNMTPSEIAAMAAMTKEDQSNKDPLLEPHIVVDYDHKPARSKDKEFFEPAQTFDYGHLSKNKADGPNLNDPMERTWKEVEEFHQIAGVQVIDYQNKSIRDQSYLADCIIDRKYDSNDNFADVRIRSEELKGRNRWEPEEKGRIRENFESRKRTWNESRRGGRKGSRDRDRRDHTDIRDIRDSRDRRNSRDRNRRSSRERDRRVSRERDRRGSRDGDRRDRDRRHSRDRSKDVDRIIPMRDLIYGRNRRTSRDREIKDCIDLTDDPGSASNSDKPIFPSISALPTNSKEPNQAQRNQALPLLNAAQDSLVSTVSKPMPPSAQMDQKIVMIDDLLEDPGRQMRPEKIAIVMRGLPGSGKSYLTKLIKDREIENGGSPPRILSIDDYFLTEVDNFVKDDVTGRKTKVTEQKYEFDAANENTYLNSLTKAFNRTVSDGYFSFVIFDCVNELMKSISGCMNSAKQNGFQVYVCEMVADVASCHKRNIHNRSLEDIEVIYTRWQRTPRHYTLLDCTTLLQNAAIDDVHMEDVSDTEMVIEQSKEEEEVSEPFASKWDDMDDIDKLARLDGTSKPLRSTSGTMEDYLQLDDWETEKKSEPGKKRVRWADIEERREQEKIRAIGFVVGQTNWERMTDPTQGSAALTQTKYIERIPK